jgi:hypothetical protein
MQATVPLPRHTAHCRSAVADETATITLQHPTQQQVDVCRALQLLGTAVPADRWCVIGGMMTEFLLLERGRSTVRPTTDGDIVGNVVAYSRVLQHLANALVGFGFTPIATGWESEIGARFRHITSGTLIDILAPANSARRRKTTTIDGRHTLEAPGTDIALETARMMRVSFGDGQALTVSVPTLAGGVYAKVSAYVQLSEHDHRVKHLQDAAQLLIVSRRIDFANPTAAMLKRLRWLDAALRQDDRAWDGIDRVERQDTVTRLASILSR